MDKKVYLGGTDIFIGLVSLLPHHSRSRVRQGIDWVFNRPGTDDIFDNYGYTRDWLEYRRDLVSRSVCCICGGSEYLSCKRLNGIKNDNRDENFRIECGVCLAISGVSDEYILNCIRCREE